MFDNVQSSGHSVVTRILLLFIVLSFCLWGIGDIFRHSGGDATVAKVGSQSVSMQEYQRALRSRQDELRARLGSSYSPELFKRLGVERQVLEGIINRSVLQQEAKAIGLSVSEDDVAEYIGRNPAFQDEHGQFSKEKYLSLLQANHVSEQSYVASVQEQMASSLLVELLTKDVKASDDLALALYRAGNERRVAGLLTIPFNAIKVVTPPSAKEIEAYYQAHQEQFMIPEYRAASYVELREQDIESSITLSDDELKKQYDDRAEEFRFPERRSIEQMVFASKQDADKASGLLATGKTFAEVAAMTPITNKGKLLLGNELTKEKMPVAADKIFALKEGGVSQPEESPFGWHIMRVVKILPAGQKPLAEVKVQLAKEMVSKAAQDAAYKLAGNVEDAMGGGATLEEAAQKAGQKVHTLKALSHDGVAEDGGKPAIPSYNSFLDAVFSTAEKDHSRMIQADNGAYFMVRVDSVKPAHARPLAEVAQAVSERVGKEQKDRNLRLLAEQVASELRAGKKLEDILAGKGIAPVLEMSGPLLQTSEMVGEGKLKNRLLPKELVAELFRIKPKTFTHAHPLPEGGYMIALLQQVIAADEPTHKGGDIAGLKALHEQLEESLSREMEAAYLQYLRKKYAITVNASLLGLGAGEEE